MNLRKALLRGVYWNSLSLLAQQVLYWGTGVVLARLLFPRDFGLMSLTMLLIGLAEAVSSLGLGTALIQRDDLREEHRCTCFWACCVLGLLCFAVILLVAPYVSVFFREEVLDSVVIVVGLSFIAGPLGAVQRSLLIRDMDFRSIARIDLAGVLVSSVASVLMALAGYGVWSLVAGYLLRVGVRVIMLRLKVSWSPSFLFKWQAFRELFNFGGYHTISRLLDFSGENIDYFIIGRFLGVTSLGYYRLGYNLMSYPQRSIVPMVGNVVFPALAKIQNDNRRICRAYLQLVSFVALATFPLLVGLMVTASEFIGVVYGEKWLPIVLPLRILCIAGMSYSVGSTVGSVLLPKGRTDMMFIMNLVRLVALSCFYAVGVRYGLSGVAIALVAYTILGKGMSQYIMYSVIGLRFREWLKAVYPAALSSAMMAVMVLGVRGAAMALWDPRPWVLLLGSVLFGAVCYVGVFCVVAPELVRRFVELLVLVCRGRSDEIGCDLAQHGV